MKAVQVEDIVDIPEYNKGKTYANLVVKEMRENAKAFAAENGFAVSLTPTLELTELAFKDGSKATQLGMLVGTFKAK